MWNCCGDGNSSSLERLQRRAAKIVSKVSDSDRTLGYLKFPSLVNRRESHVHELVKRCIKGRCPQFFKSYFIFNSFVIDEKAMFMSSSKDALKDVVHNFLKAILFLTVLSTIEL